MSESDTGSVGESLGGGWLKYFDEEYQRPYFHHVQSKRTTWTFPPLLTTEPVPPNNTGSPESQDDRRVSLPPIEPQQPALTGGRRISQSTLMTDWTKNVVNMNRFIKRTSRRLRSIHHHPNSDEDDAGSEEDALDQDEKDWAERLEKAKSEFTERELFKLREEFNSCDADRSGFIDENELGDLLTVLNEGRPVHHSEVMRIMREADASGDGQLDFGEFLTIVKKFQASKKLGYAEKMKTIQSEVKQMLVTDLIQYGQTARRLLRGKTKLERAQEQAEQQEEEQRQQEEKKQRALERKKKLLEEEEQKRLQAKGGEAQLPFPFQILFPGNEIDFPEADSVVSVHIKVSTVSDGNLFENSRERGKPFKFRIDGGAVIPGLAMLVEKMSLGTRCVATIPPKYAYGERGLPPKVPRFATLQVDVEVLKIELKELD